MSAFFVGADHIDAILSWLDTCAQCSVELPNGYRNTPTTCELTFIGKALLSENIASLRHRYPLSWQEMVDIDVNFYGFEHDGAFITRTRDLTVSVLKLINCYMYQSCEHPEWDTSWAKRFCQELKAQAVRMLPGYESACWQYEKPQDAGSIVRLT